MGTIHWADGIIEFDPPLTAKDLRSDLFEPYLSPDNQVDTLSDSDLMLVVEQDEVDTDDGVLQRRYARRIAPAWPRNGKNYSPYFEDSLRRLVDLLNDGRPRTFTGAIVIMRETHTVDADFAVRRVTVADIDDTPVVHVAPLVWSWGDPQPHHTPERTLLGARLRNGH